MSHDRVVRINEARSANDPFEDLSPEAARDAARNLTQRVIEQSATITRLGRDNDLLRAMHAELETANAARIEVLWPTAAIDVEPVPQLVAGLIAQGSLTLLFGEPGTGKSTLAMDLAQHVATGKLWRGRRVSQGLALHLAGEGRHGVQMRLAAGIREGIGTERMPFGILSGALNLATAVGVADLLAAVRDAEAHVGEQTALLIVDTLARCAPIDENDGQQLGLVIRACDTIREATGAAILVIHHSGKDSSRGARGHSSLRAAVDTEILVEGRSNPRTLIVTKQRDLPTAEPMSFDLVPVKVATDLETFEDLTACVVRHSDQAPALAKPSGKQQATLLAELERRYATGEVAWTDADLRKIGRELEMSKPSARSAVLGLHGAGYLCPSVGGATLKQPPEAKP